MTAWTVFRHDDPATWPEKTGLYAVRVSEDSEHIDGFPVYEYPAYTTFATLGDPDADGHREFKGEHDEEPHFYDAWYGPIEIPACDV